MTYFLPSGALYFYRILSILALTTILAHTQGAQPPDKTPEAGKSSIPPIVEFQAHPLTEKAGIGEKVHIFWTLSNKSALKISNLTISCPENIFILENLPKLSELSPFQSATGTVTLVVGKNTPFSKYKVPLTFSYTYDPEPPKPKANTNTAPVKSGKHSGPAAAAAPPPTPVPPASAQAPSLVTIEVVRSFDEEAKGFPGGTAAFLYLLLPIIPAMLSFQFANNLRKGLGPQMPTFKSEDIVPAFLFAVVVSFIVLLVFDLDYRLGLSNTIFFLMVLAASAVAGTLIPIGHYLYGRWQMRKWGFKESDSHEEYLRKALMSPYSPGGYQWITGTIGMESFEGVLLKQPTGKAVLGALIQVSPSSQPAETYSTRLNKLQNDALVNKELLLEMIESGEAKLDIKRMTTRNSRVVDSPVLIPPAGELKSSGAPIEIVSLSG